MRRLVVQCALMLAFAAPQPVAAQVAPSSRFSLTILHTNDQHGHLLPFAYQEDGVDKAERPSVGGISRRSTLIKRLRQTIANPTILIDAGDTFTRGPFTLAYRGIADTEAMNAAGYELAVLGNNEFKAYDGADQQNAPAAQEALLQVVKRSRFPWICANAGPSSGGTLQGVQPYVVREFGGVRVGFLGLTAPRCNTYPQTLGWTFGDPVVAAREWVPKARAHCDVLIAVTHIGVDEDRNLAAKVPGIDAIVGGDSHTFLHKRLLVKGPAGNNVPIVQTGEFGVYLGRFDLTFIRASGKWRLASNRSELLPVGPGLPNDPRVDGALEQYVRPFRKPVGRLAQVAATPLGRTVQTTLVVAEATRAAAKADLALMPPGGGMFEVFRRPVVTRCDVFAALPFRNRVVSVQMTGQAIADLRKAHPTTIVAGLSSGYDPTRTYRVALVDYIAASEYEIDPARFADAGCDIQDAVIRHLGRTSPAAQTARTATKPTAPARVR